MKETILLAPGANEKELLQALALRGKNTIGVRVLGGFALAERVLMRAGKPGAKNCLTLAEEAAIVWEILCESDVEYFRAASYLDAKNIAAALDLLRSWIPGEESDGMERVLGGGEFPEKNAALLEIFRRYQSIREARGREDTVSCMRRAIAEGETIAEEILCLEEYPLSPLERALGLAASGGDLRSGTLPELFGAEVPEKPDVKSYTAAYGAGNEAAAVLGRIYEDGLPFDACVIAAADPGAASQLWYDLSQLYRIPVTFGCGIPMLNTFPARLLKALDRWEREGCCGADAWKALAADPAFDRAKLDEFLPEGEKASRGQLLELCGSLRLGRDGAENRRRLEAYRIRLPQESGERKLAEAAGRLAAVWEKGYASVLRTFGRIRKGPDGGADRAALRSLCAELDALKDLPGGGAEERLIPTLLSGSVGGQGSTPGALHLTSLQGAMSSMRENCFLVGLSADVFPGAAEEDYLLADSDWERLATGDAPTSERKVRQKMEEYDRLLRLCAALGCSVHLSFPDYDPAELKQRNVSSLVLNTFRRQFGRDARPEDLNSAGYYERIFTLGDAYGREYKAGGRSGGSMQEAKAAAAAYDLERAWSPTAIDAWRTCPRRFFLRYALQLPEPEEDDPYRVIDPAARGNLAHDLLETLAPETEREPFLRRAGEAFDAFLLRRPPVNAEAADHAREDFMQMMENAYDADPRNLPLAAEHELQAEHPSGVKIYGRPDRIERTPDGKIIVVDYKTGRSVKHVPNDFDSCLQALLYAFVLEAREKGSGEEKELDAIGQVDHVEFRYPAVNAVVSCGWNAEMKQKLSALLARFAADLQAGECRPGPVCDDYCGFRGICRGEEEETEGEE